MTKPAHASPLERLERLIGAWAMDITLAGQTVVRGRAEFSWFEGRAFVVQHVTAEPFLTTTPEQWRTNSPFPIVTVIGLDDSSGLLSYLYTDGRGVRRIYRMTLEDDVWEISGQAGPRFFQRFRGTFSRDGRTLTAYWERSENNKSWLRDFDVRYTKVR
jgi:hypothetical protein